MPFENKENKERKKKKTGNELDMPSSNLANPPKKT